jgi:hypothetical protein
MQVNTNTPHGLENGQIISIYTPYFSRLKSTISRPRITVVKDVTPSSFNLEHRRMNWSEWRVEVIRALLNK